MTFELPDIFTQMYLTHEAAISDQLKLVVIREPKCLKSQEYLP